MFPGNGGHQLRCLLLSGQAQALIYSLWGYWTWGGGCALIQKAYAVPEGTIGHSGQNHGGLGLQADMLLGGHILQPGGHILRRNASEGKTLAAGKNGSGNLVQLCGGQNENQVLRRLLNDFQEGVEGGDG